MRAAPPAIPITTPPPRAPRRRHVCRACNRTIYAIAPTGATWIEDDLCSSCHGPYNPTRAQAGELARIRERCGPYVAYKAEVGWLHVHLLEPWAGDEAINGLRVKRILRMTPQGRVVR